MARAKSRKSQQRRKTRQAPRERQGEGGSLAVAPPSTQRERLAAMAEPLGLLEGLFAHSPVPYAIFGAEGGCLLTNPAYRVMFGREPPPGYNIFQDEVAQRQGVAELLRRGFHGETVRTPIFWYDPEELVHVQAPGAKRVAISCTVFPLARSGGEVRHVAIAYKDVTAELTIRDAEQERLIRELAEERVRLRAVLDNIPAGVVLAEAPSGRIILGNAQVERILGRAVESHEWSMARVLQGEAVPGEDFLHERGDGTRRWVRVESAPIRHEERITGAVLAFHDIHQEKRTQERLRALADTSTALAQASTDFCSALEKLARLAAETLGECIVLTLLDEEAGQLDILASYHPDPEARRLLKDSLRGAYGRTGGPAMEVVKSGRPVLRPRIPQEGLIERMPPEVRPFLARFGLRSSVIVPLRAQGKVIGTLGASRGQPEPPYTLEDQDFLQEMADRAGLAIQNVRLLETARKAVRLRDDFLSVASHELKTPLTPLSLKLQSLARQCGSEQGPEQAQRLARDVESMRRQVRRLSELINDLLDVARISGGRLSLELEPVDLTGLVREVTSRFEPEAERTGGRLATCVNGPVVGRWDRLRLEQVVTNLLSNALKYGAGKPVEVSVVTEGEQARLRVRDEGIGIDATQLARIFEKFERAVSERHYGGLGLGLYITRQIVEALGGRISVESELQQGAVFTVLLPLRGPGTMDR